MLLVLVVWNWPKSWDMPEEDCTCRSFKIVVELSNTVVLCVMDEEGLFVCLYAFLCAVFAIWFSLKCVSATAKTSTAANFCLPHTQHIHPLKLVLYFSSHIRSVWISHKGLVKQVASLTHPTDQPFTSVRCVSKEPHTSQKDLLSSVRVLRLWVKFMLLCWLFESFSLQGLQLPYELEGADLVSLQCTLGCHYCHRFR